MTTDRSDRLQFFFVDIFFLVSFKLSCSCLGWLQKNFFQLFFFLVEPVCSLLFFVCLLMLYKCSTSLKKLWKLKLKIMLIFLRVYLLIISDFLTKNMNCIFCLVSVMNLTVFFCLNLNNKLWNELRTRLRIIPWNFCKSLTYHINTILLTNLWACCLTRNDVYHV